MKDFREAIPYDTKCGLCKRRKGNHKAGTFHCPLGLRGRANTYSFSVTQRFEPVMPKLPVEVKKLLANLVFTTGNKAVMDHRAFHENVDSAVTDGANELYVAARYAMQAHLNSIFYPSTKLKV